VVTGALVGAAAAAVGLLVIGVVMRGAGITALRKPPAVETRAAKAAWRFLVPRDVREAANPVASSPDALRDALAHFADHCAVCHGNDGSGDTVIGRRTYPPAPDLRKRASQGLSDGELFYAIEEGIPWTAMPGWRTGTPEGARQSWGLVRFIRHLPALTADELEAMERLNPKSPGQVERDREIDDFLRGTDTAEPAER
jgi:mono/diheme cytochrome c family protein